MTDSPVANPASVPYTEDKTSVPSDFTYPWGEYWRQQNGWDKSIRRPRRSLKFARRMSAADRKALNRITSNRKRFTDAELGIHPDQPILEVP